MAPIRVCDSLNTGTAKIPSEGLEDQLVLLAYDSQGKWFSVTSHSLVILPQTRKKHFPSLVE